MGADDTHRSRAKRPEGPLPVLGPVDALQACESVVREDRHARVPLDAMSRGVLVLDFTDELHLDAAVFQTHDTIGTELHGPDAETQRTHCLAFRRSAASRR